MLALEQTIFPVVWPVDWYMASGIMVIFVKLLSLVSTWSSGSSGSPGSSQSSQKNIQTIGTIRKIQTIIWKPGFNQNKWQDKGTQYGLWSFRSMVRFLNWAILNWALRDRKGNPKTRKPESGIGNRKPESGIRNPESGIRNPESRIRNPESGIKNPQIKENKFFKYAKIIFHSFCQ